MAQCRDVSILVMVGILLHKADLPNVVQFLKTYLVWLCIIVVYNLLLTAVVEK